MHTDTPSSPCLLGGGAEAWGQERGTFSCEEPEATSQLAVLVAKGDPRGVGLGPGNLVLLPSEGRSVTPRTRLMLPLASEASLTCGSQTARLRAPLAGEGGLGVHTWWWPLSWQRLGC